MAQNVDWKNANVRAIEADNTLITANLDSKDRKYQNLQSSVFGGGYVEQAPIEHDREQQNYKHSSTADWKQEATKARPNNGVSKQDPYMVKQKDLGSQIFEQTDYYSHMSLSKSSS